jgi:hypothetical protein
MDRMRIAWLFTNFIFDTLFSSEQDVTQREEKLLTFSVGAVTYIQITTNYYILTLYNFLAMAELE